MPYSFLWPKRVCLMEWKMAPNYNLFVLRPHKNLVKGKEFSLSFVLTCSKEGRCPNTRNWRGKSTLGKDGRGRQDTHFLANLRIFRVVYYISQHFSLAVRKYWRKKYICIAKSTFLTQRVHFWCNKYTFDAISILLTQGVHFWRKKYISTQRLPDYWRKSIPLTQKYTFDAKSTHFCVKWRRDHREKFFSHCQDFAIPE